MIFCMVLEFFNIIRSTLTSLTHKQLKRGIARNIYDYQLGLLKPKPKPYPYVGTKNKPNDFNSMYGFEYFL